MGVRGRLLRNLGGFRLLQDEKRKLPEGSGRGK